MRIWIVTLFRYTPSVRAAICTEYCNVGPEVWGSTLLVANFLDQFSLNVGWDCQSLSAVVCMDFSGPTQPEPVLIRGKDTR